MNNLIKMDITLYNISYFTNSLNYEETVTQRDLSQNPIILRDPKTNTLYELYLADLFGDTIAPQTAVVGSINKCIIITKLEKIVKINDVEIDELQRKEVHKLKRGWDILFFKAYTMNQNDILKQNTNFVRMQQRFDQRQEMERKTHENEIKFLQDGNKKALESYQKTIEELRNQLSELTSDVFKADVKREKRAMKDTMSFLEADLDEDEEDYESPD